MSYRHICYDRSVNIFLPALLGIALLILLCAHLLNRKKQAGSEGRVHALETDLARVRSTAETLSKTLSDLRAIHSSEQYAQHIISKLNQGIMYIDQHRAVVFINRYGEQFLHNTETIGKPYTDVLRMTQNGRNDNTLIEEAFSGKSAVFPDGTAIITRSGAVPVSGSVLSVVIDDPGRAVVVAFIDDTVNAEHEKEEKAFFSQTAHELRTPLTVIRLTVGLLLKQYDTLGREKILEHLRRADITAEHLVKLINDFLYMSRIELGRLDIDIKPFDMLKLTDEVVRDLTPLATERKLYLHHDGTDLEYRTVIGDPVRSKEVMTNLISNGIKYTVQGGVTVTHRAKDNMLLTTVADTGAGIPQEFQRMLFRRFTQVGEAREQPTAKSTGLGLYISKKTAQLMHGDVYLESSEPGKGSVFCFTLPLG